MQNLGHFFILLDTKKLGSTQWLSDRMTDFANILTESPPADPSKPVIVPGMIELAKMEEQLANGIELNPETLQMVEKFASKS